MKADDSSLSSEQYSSVKLEAEKVLRNAGALGVYPTPIDQLMSMQNIEEIKEDVLSISFVEKYRKQAGQNLRRAVGKVLGLFDAAARLIFIDRSLLQVRQNFIRLHELGHSQMPWQKDLYAVIEDSKNSLDPALADLFDREANVFASEVLFQLDGFSKAADEKEFCLGTPISLSKRYGASIYSSIRRYVKHNNRVCTVIVLNMPEFKSGLGFSSSIRRIVSSPAFEEMFGKMNWGTEITPDHLLGELVPLDRRNNGYKQLIPIIDRNGEQYECIAEAFTNSYQVFILIHPVRSLSRTNVVVPSMDDINKYSNPTV